jgi:hypothetical protein
MTHNTSDILLTPVTVYTAAYGEALPDNDLAYGSAWGGNWRDVGYTLTPLTIGYETEVTEVEVEQLTLPVKEIKTKETVTLETTLAEFTQQNLVLAFDGSGTTVAAGTANVGYEQFDTGGETTIDTYAWGFEGKYVDGSNNIFPVRVFLYKGSAKVNGQLSFGKSEPAGIPLQIKAQADTTKTAGEQLMRIVKVTAAATE